MVNDHEHFYYWSLNDYEKIMNQVIIYHSLPLSICMAFWCLPIIQRVCFLQVWALLPENHHCKINRKHNSWKLWWWWWWWWRWRRWWGCCQHLGSVPCLGTAWPCCWCCWCWLRPDELIVEKPWRPTMMIIDHDKLDTSCWWWPISIMIYKFKKLKILIWWIIQGGWHLLPEGGAILGAWPWLRTKNVKTPQSIIIYHYLEKYANLCDGSLLGCRVA